MAIMFLVMATDTSNQTTQAANREGANLAAVITDMILAGKTAELDALYNAEVTAGSWERALAAFVAFYQANVNAYYALNLEYSTPPKVYVAASRKGQRFLRIWSDDGSRYCLGFVEPATGYLWKCAGWKAPETNFPRASMYTRPKFTGGIYNYYTRYQGPAIAPGYTGNNANNACEKS